MHAGNCVPRVHLRDSSWDASKWVFSPHIVAAIENGRVAMCGEMNLDRQRYTDEVDEANCVGCLRSTIARARKDYAELLKASQAEMASHIIDKILLEKAAIPMTDILQELHRNTARWESLAKTWKSEADGRMKELKRLDPKTYGES